MKFKSTKIIVADMERAKAFYKTVLGMRVVMDLGDDVTLNSGLTLHTVESWKAIVESKNVLFGGKDAELYFEEINFDSFIEHLNEFPEIRYVHSPKEQAFGQRAVRFYDPDLHIVEVAESMKEICNKYLESGMSVAEVADKLNVPVKFINSIKRL